MSASLVKPPRQQATTQQEQPASRFLYIAGVGEALGTDVEELRRMLEAFGPLGDNDNEEGESGAIELPPGKGFVLVRFREEGAAGRAKEALAGQTVEGRRLKVEFSALAEEAGGEGGGRPGPCEPLDPADCQDVEIPGLTLVEDFLTEEEEAALMALADGEGEEGSGGGGGSWQEGVPGMSRRVQHFGYRFDYATRNVAFPETSSVADADASVPSPLPPPLPYEACPAFGHAVRRLLREKVMTGPPDQLTVNEYLPGQGIAGHVETHDAFRDGIVSLSLGAPVVMDFRHAATGARKSLLLRPRSALALYGEARYLWTHGIAARTWDKVDGARVPRAGRRLSFTLRRVNPLMPSGERRPCLCPFPQACASAPEAREAYLERVRAGEGDVPPEAIKPTELEKAHVHAVYETISSHWNHTRAIRRVHWPRVVQFIQGLPPHALIADVGCGDGKYLELRQYDFHPSAFAIGCDRSVRLLECSKRAAAAAVQSDGAGDAEKGIGAEGEGGGAAAGPTSFEVFACDVLKVPFRDGAFDAALCIAVLHHFSTEAHRVQALRELCRVVRVGGVFDVHVWAMEQEDGSRRRFESQDALVPFRMQAKYASQPLEALAATATASASSAAAASSSAAAEAGGAAAGAGAGQRAVASGPPPIPEAVPSKVDTQAKLVTYDRYCHVYREWELEALVNKLGPEYELEVLDRGYDKGNWFLTLRKARDLLKEEGR